MANRSIKEDLEGFEVEVLVSDTGLLRRRHSLIVRDTGGGTERARKLSILDEPKGTRGAPSKSWVTKVLAEIARVSGVPHDRALYRKFWRMYKNSHKKASLVRGLR